MLILKERPERFVRLRALLLCKGNLQNKTGLTLFHYLDDKQVFCSLSMFVASKVSKIESSLEVSFFTPSRTIKQHFHDHVA